MVLVLRIKAVHWEFVEKAIDQQVNLGHTHNAKAHLVPWTLINISVRNRDVRGKAALRADFLPGYS